ncbi:MAG: IS200/IS605 family transposase [Phormidium sp.]
MNNDFVSKGRSVSDLKAHLVLTTKYRRKVFDGVMLTRLHNVFGELLEKWDCKLVDFNGEEDHVHLLIQYHPDLQLSSLVNNLKAVSSRKIRNEFAQVVNAIYQKDVLWNGSYFVASCGGVTVSVLRKYMESQDRPS